MSFGTGVIMCKSAKHKLNTKSSIESEVVGARDYTHNVVWADICLKHQSIILETNECYQDNHSAMKLEKNGKRSCAPGSRHVDIRYFFTKNRLEYQ